MIISPTNKRYLPWYFLVLVILSLLVAANGFGHIEQQWQIALTLVGASAAFIHFLYSRHLEETKMFHELFMNFNQRYDALNGGLNEIVMGPDSNPLTPDDKRLLYDYFNLCGEEFYFYRIGYIPDEVWNAWRSGICLFIRVPKIKELMKTELDTGSYYGLTIDEILRGQSAILRD